MAIIRALRAFISYLISKIRKKDFIADDEFFNIIEKENELIYLLYSCPDRERRNHVENVRGIKECISTMLHTEEPDVFALKYGEALALAEEILSSGCEVGEVNACAYELYEMLVKLRNPAPESVVAPFTYYSVTFRNKKKTYYYLSKERAYRVGQHVLVPVGEDMEIRVVRIVGVETFDADNVPMPPEDLKTIEGPALY